MKKQTKRQKLQTELNKALHEAVMTQQTESLL